jgi:hypothetical protein
MATNKEIRTGLRQLAPEELPSWLDLTGNPTPPESLTFRVDVVCLEDRYESTVVYPNGQQTHNHLCSAAEKGAAVGDAVRTMLPNEVGRDTIPSCCPIGAAKWDACAATSRRARLGSRRRAPRAP